MPLHLFEHIHSDQQRHYQSCLQTAAAKAVTQLRRVFIVDCGKLEVLLDMAAVGQPLQAS